MHAYIHTYIQTNVNTTHAIHIYIHIFMFYLKVMANADTPADAIEARRNGAQGIKLKFIYRLN